MLGRNGRAQPTRRDTLHINDTFQSEAYHRSRANESAKWACLTAAHTLTTVTLVGIAGHSRIAATRPRGVRGAHTARAVVTSCAQPDHAPTPPSLAAEAEAEAHVDYLGPEAAHITSDRQDKDTSHISITSSSAC